MSYRKIVLIGNPNCGKTTLFNQLTGANQRVGNWSGVTVEQKIGQIKTPEGKMDLIDLPGLYSIVTDTSELGIDEKLTCDYLASQDPDCVINVVDAPNLERNLYLSLQLLEKGLPVVIVVNRIDLLHKKGLTIDAEKLSTQLGCPVWVANQVSPSIFKKQIMECVNNIKISELVVSYPADLENSIKDIQDKFQMNRAQAIDYLDNFDSDDSDILIAKARYQLIDSIFTSVIQPYSGRFMLKNRVISQLIERLDSFALHRVFGIPIFLAVMYALFMFAINVGGAFQDFFDIASNAIFVEGFAHLLLSLSLPSWLIAILASGLGKGINTLLTFIPVIGAMFLALTFLEESGYMARAAFVMDRFMRAIGLPGKSFVPLIVGFGCNVPAIMGARTLEKKRDRILTVVMSPFMSCGARLAIFTLFVAAFFPQGGQNIVFLLYLIGIGMAILTGLLLKKTLLRGAPTPMVLELPNFHLPRMKNIVVQAYRRLSNFMRNAGKIIIPVCIIIGVLNSISITGQFISEEDSHQDSLLASVSKIVTPVFSPMGITQENWPATVGLFSGILAKEVVIGTLNSLYTQDHTHVKMESVFSIQSELKSALISIPNNLLELGGMLTNPLKSKTELPEFSEQERVYGEMLARFDGKVGAFAYLLFVLLYFPCVSVTAAMLKEVDRKWTLFSVVWTTGVAYSVAVLFYQIATFNQHVLYSTACIALIVAVMAWVIIVMNRKRFIISRELPTRIVLAPFNLD